MFNQWSLTFKNKVQHTTLHTAHNSTSAKPTIQHSTLKNTKSAIERFYDK